MNRLFKGSTNDLFSHCHLLHQISSLIIPYPLPRWCSDAFKIIDTELNFPSDVSMASEWFNAFYDAYLLFDSSLTVLTVLTTAVRTICWLWTHLDIFSFHNTSFGFGFEQPEFCSWCRHDLRERSVESSAIPPASSGNCRQMAEFGEFLNNHRAFDNNHASGCMIRSVTHFQLKPHSHYTIFRSSKWTTQLAHSPDSREAPRLRGCGAELYSGTELCIVRGFYKFYSSFGNIFLDRTMLSHSYLQHRLHSHGVYARNDSE